MDSPTAIDVIEEGVNNTAEEDWPEEAVEAEEACEEAPGSERLEELVAEETVRASLCGSVSLADQQLYSMLRMCSVMCHHPYALVSEYI